MLLVFSVCCCVVIDSAGDNSHVKTVYILWISVTKCFQIIEPHKRDPHEEIEILMRYDHPNIVKLRDVCFCVADND